MTRIFNTGSSLGEPNKDWYIRVSSTDTWYGPLSYRDANRQARLATIDGTDLDVKYMQIGTYLGARDGDPITDPARLFVIAIYVNGKLTFRGRQAEFHKDKY